MWESRKGTATLFRADRRWAAILAKSLAADIILNLNYEARIPTPPQAYESPISIHSI